MDIHSFYYQELAYVCVHIEAMSKKGAYQIFTIKRIAEISIPTHRKLKVSKTAWLFTFPSQTVLVSCTID